MDHIDKARATGIYFLLASGVVLIGLSFVVSEGFDFICAFLGIGFIFGAAVNAAILGAFHLPILGIKWLDRFASPKWDDEILHTESGEFQIRYGFDELGIPWFVAHDVCVAIDIKPPSKVELKWGKMSGLPLSTHKGLATFSEKTVQDFLALHIEKSPAANKLLNRIRSHVLRKIEKQREDNLRFKNLNSDKPQ